MVHANKRVKKNYVYKQLLQEMHLQNKYFSIEKSNLPSFFVHLLQLLEFSSIYMNYLGQVNIYITLKVV